MFLFSLFLFPTIAFFLIYFRPNKKKKGSKVLQFPTRNLSHVAPPGCCRGSHGGGKGAVSWDTGDLSSPSSSEDNE